MRAPSGNLLLLNSNLKGGENINKTKAGNKINIQTSWSVKNSASSLADWSELMVYADTGFSGVHECSHSVTFS